VTGELSAGDRGGNLLSFLPRPIREPRQPLLALAVAWLLTYPISIALAGVVSLVIPDAPQPHFDMSGLKALFLLVVFAPVAAHLGEALDSEATPGPIAPRLERFWPR